MVIMVMILFPHYNKVNVKLFQDMGIAVDSHYDSCTVFYFVLVRVSCRVLFRTLFRRGFAIQLHSVVELLDTMRL